MIGPINRIENNKKNIYVHLCIYVEWVIKGGIFFCINFTKFINKLKKAIIQFVCVSKNINTQIQQQKCLIELLIACLVEWLRVYKFGTYLHKKADDI